MGFSRSLRPLDGRVALVTGATRGIGKAIAESLASRGARVVVHGRDGDRAHSVARALTREHDVHCIGVAADLTDAAEAQTVVKAVHAEFRALSIMVCNAGAFLEGRSGMIRVEAIDHLFALNARAPLLLCQSASRLMTRSGGGSIIAVGSIVAHDGAPGYAAYAMSKAAIAGLVNCLSLELGPSGIRVNGIEPGVIDTELNAQLSLDRRAALLERTPLGRLGTTADVADVVAFFAGDDSRFVTGQLLRIDGGLRL